MGRLTKIPRAGSWLTAAIFPSFSVPHLHAPDTPIYPLVSYLHILTIHPRSSSIHCFLIHSHGRGTREITHCQGHSLHSFFFHLSVNNPNESERRRNEGERTPASLSFIKPPFYAVGYPIILPSFPLFSFSY